VLDAVGEEARHIPRHPDRLAAEAVHDGGDGIADAGSVCSPRTTSTPGRDARQEEMQVGAARARGDMPAMSVMR